MSDNDSETDYAAAHTAALKRLKSKDPDFYEFLKENDQELLEFNDSDDDKALEDEEEEGQAPESEDLESEESDKWISAPKLQYIKEKIKSAPTKKIVKELINAFKVSVQQADSFNDKVDLCNSELFNEVIKLCLIDLVPALYVVLKLPSDGAKRVDAASSKLWKKMHMTVKSYLIDLLKLFSVLKEPSVVTLLLKHVIHLIPFYSKFIKLCRLLLKKMISFWCCEEETVRVLSLIVIVRASKYLPPEYLGNILKHMYLSYVRNTKFTSPSSWPMINFMKRSITEVYALNTEIAYQHAFIYIRQLAIHLRNAVTMKKKESYQAVYNWQYIHCLMMWGHLLCRFHDHEALKTLIYPFVQTIIGTITLIPTSKYVPLRFHLIRTLIHMSKNTNIFVPVLPFVLEVLTITNFNRKSSFSVKSLEFTCSLKVAKSKLAEAAFKDGCIKEVCDLLLDYLKIYSHTIGFPELALPAALQIKQFIKHGKVSKYNQQLKSVLMKISENSSFIAEKRRRVSFRITDVDEIRQWEQELMDQGTPLMKVQVGKTEMEPEESLRKKQRVK